MLRVGGVDIHVDSCKAVSPTMLLDRRGRGGGEEQTGMTMRSPANLGSPTDNICKDIRCGPGVRVIYQAVDLIVCGIVDSESLLDEVFADVGG